MSRAAELPLPLDRIHDLYPALVRALADAGEPAPRIQELLQQHLRIACVGCGERISPDEIAALSLLNADTPDAGPRMERLRLAYCAREGCKSRFYACSANSGMVAWPDIFARTRRLIEQPPATTPESANASAEDGQAAESPAPASPRPFRERWRRLQFGVLGGMALLAALFWWWRSGARIPGIGPAPRQFEVISAPADPSLLSPTNPPAPVTPAAPGTPRAFRSQ